MGKRISARGVVAVTLASAVSFGANACAGFEGAPEAKGPGRANVTSVIHKGNHREIIAHSEARDSQMAQRIIDFCKNGTYYRTDPARIEYGGLMDTTQPIHEKLAEVACRDGRITRNDPMPNEMIPDDYDYIFEG